LAVSRSQVTSHLWEKHQISPESRRNITSLIRSLQIPDPTGIPLRPNQSLSHPYLKVYRGYACHTCDSRIINLDTITCHVSSCRPQPLSRRRKNPDDLAADSSSGPCIGPMRRDNAPHRSPATLLAKHNILSPILPKTVRILRQSGNSLEISEIVEKIHSIPLPSVQISSRSSAIGARDSLYQDTIEPIKTGIGRQGIGRGRGWAYLQ
jgi:hypothetical protein